MLFQLKQSEQIKMKISIIKEEVKTVNWKDIKHGGLFQDSELGGSPLYIKTTDDRSICLRTGDAEDLFYSEHQVIDVTDKYLIVNL